LKLTLDLVESLPYLATDIRCMVSFQHSDGLNDFSQGIRGIDHFPDWMCTSGESVQTLVEVGPKFIEHGVQIGHCP
jgi:hypothetical protein